MFRSFLPNFTYGSNNFDLVYCIYTHKYFTYKLHSTLLPKFSIPAKNSFIVFFFKQLHKPLFSMVKINPRELYSVL